MSTSKLLGCDPQEVSPARAGAVFAEGAKALAEKDNTDLTAAWRKMKALEPDLHARMTQTGEQSESAAVANAAPAQVFVPKNKDVLLPMMGLPADTTDGEFAAIVRGNGGTRAPLNAKGAWPYLTAHIATRDGVSQAAARSTAIDKFRSLAQAAGELNMSTPGLRGLASAFDPTRKSPPAAQVYGQTGLDTYPQAKPFSGGTNQVS